MDFIKPKRRVTRVFLHCSASDQPAHDNVETMRRWHKERGWSDVGYHLFIRKDGTVEPGRSLELTPAAQAGHNAATIAICLHGLHKDAFTQAQFASLQRLIGQIDKAYDGAVTVHGHREVACKACPVFDYIGVLGLDARGYYDGPDAIGADAEKDVPLSRQLRRGASGPDVRALQAALKALGFDCGRMDGDFGDRTLEAVKRFQEARHLIPDGIVGVLTREALDAA